MAPLVNAVATSRDIRKKTPANGPGLLEVRKKALLGPLGLIAGHHRTTKLVVHARGEEIDVLLPAISRVTLT
jgi:hypothetical protein